MTIKELLSDLGRFSLATERLSAGARVLAFVAADWTLRAATLVAVGGALGCVLRYLAGVWFTRPTGWPWGTIAVNLAGSFVIALMMFGALSRFGTGDDARAFLVTGLLGGFTTMSAFAYETTVFVVDREFYQALAYAAVTVVGSLAMAALGRAVALATR
jgi:CrcB protein